MKEVSFYFGFYFSLVLVDEKLEVGGHKRVSVSCRKCYRQLGVLPVLQGVEREAKGIGACIQCDRQYGGKRQGRVLFDESHLPVTAWYGIRCPVCLSEADRFSAGSVFFLGDAVESDVILHQVFDALLSEPTAQVTQFAVNLLAFVFGERFNPCFVCLFREGQLQAPVALCQSIFHLVVQYLHSSQAIPMSRGRRGRKRRVSSSAA